MIASVTYPQDWYIKIYSWADKELHEIAKTRIIAIRNIYNKPAFTIPTFILLEFGLGLSKTLSRYKCVTDGVAYKGLLKISNRRF